MKKDELKEDLNRSETWLRGLYMLLFAVAYTVAEVVLVVVVVFQFFLRLTTGQVNQRLLKLGQQLSTYLYQLLTFFTFNSEEHPYPFAAWPRGAPAQPRTSRRPTSGKKIGDATQTADGNNDGSDPV